MTCVLGLKLQDLPIGDRTYYWHKTCTMTYRYRHSYATNIFEQSCGLVLAECAINSIPVTFGARELLLLNTTLSSDGRVGTSALWVRV